MVTFRLLGPLEVHSPGGGHIAVPGMRERRLLAALASEHGRVIPVERLIGLLWDNDPPATAVKQIHNSVARLRRALGAGGLDRDQIALDGPGYRLVIADSQLDLAQFDALVATARQRSARGEHTEAAVCYQRALSLRRSRALDGIDGQAMRAIAGRIEDRILAVLEAYAALRLRLGQHTDTVTDLTGVVHEHPLREGLIGLLMRALAGSGRQAEAIELFQVTRARLVEQLGLEPGPQLQQSFQCVLNGSDTAAPAAAAPIAAGASFLPLNPPDFVGRERELWQLHELARPIAVVSGMAGVGKTALAVRFAYRAREQYSDGQLYIDLHGYDQADPVRPDEALRCLLRQLAVGPEQVPVAIDEAAALYRSLLATKRVLVVLDNARTAEQVRPLLPGGIASSSVVITSRESLSGLIAREGARRMILQVLPPAEAVDLIGRMIGGARVTAEPTAAVDLVELCGRLPVALRIAAAHLADRQDVKLASYVDELETAPDVIGALSIRGDDSSVLRAIFGRSYDLLAKPARAVFGWIGVVKWHDFTPAAIAAAGAASATDAASTLEDLANAQLVRREGAERYTVHDLIRCFARDLTPVRQREAVLGRVLDYYSGLAARVHLALSPWEFHVLGRDARTDLVTPAIAAAEAHRWFETEADNAIAIARQCASEPALQTGVLLLIRALCRPLARRHRWYDLEVLSDLATVVAGRLGDTASVAFGRQQHAHAALHLGAIEAGTAESLAALGLYRAVDDPWGEFACLLDLGWAHRSLGRTDEAAAHLTEAAVVSGRSGDEFGQAYALDHLGLLQQSLGRYAEAAEQHRQALIIRQRLAFPRGVAASLINIGWANLRDGDPSSAAGYFMQGEEISRQSGFDYELAESLWGKAEAAYAQGRDPEAREHWLGSLAILKRMGALRPDEADTLQHHERPAIPRAISGQL